MNITKKSFGKTLNSEDVEIFTLLNNNGMEINITNYGGIVQSLKTKDRNGKYEDVVLGYDDLESYIEATPYFGAIVGRYCNRISDAKFNIDGIEYKLTKNFGKNHIHGGEKGFDKVVWKATTTKTEDSVSLKLEYFSKAGEEGYPGNLNVIVVYTLSNNDELIIKSDATTDKKTLVNLTTHSYFNLTANPKNNILDHSVWINADRYVPIDSRTFPLGNLDLVKDSPFDFTHAKKIGENISDDNLQLSNGDGYDHCYALNDYDKKLKLQATAYEENSGRYLEVFTDQPGIQLYSGNFLAGYSNGKQKITYENRSGFCLETQHYPDSPNHSQFPSTELRPDEVYSTTTIYKFSVK